MGQESRLGRKIFLQYGALILVLGGFNFYRYYTVGGLWTLIVGIVCCIGFLAWIIFYFFYVKGKEKI
jgi:hypothetical protein